MPIFDENVFQYDNVFGEGFDEVGMSDTQQSMDQLNKLFQLLTLTMLGKDILIAPWIAYQADPGAWVGDVPVNPYSLVRIAWPKKGAPAWKIDDDVIFLRVLEIDRYQQKDIILENDMNQATGFTRINSVAWMLYGPNSYDNAQTICYRIFNQDIHDVLAKSNLFLIPNTASPRRSPEVFEEQYWERVDLMMWFNELVIRNSAIPAIASVDVETTLDGTNFVSKIMT